MRNKTYISIITSGVVLSLIVVILFINNLNFKSELGYTTSYLRDSVSVKLSHSIRYLESDALSKEDFKDDLYMLSTLSFMAANTSHLSFLNLHTVIRDYTGAGVDYDRLFTSEEYRDEFLTVLKKYHSALQFIFTEEREYTDSHYISSMPILLDRFSGKAQYDYHTRKPLNKAKYKTRVEEDFFTKLNE